MLAGVGGVDKIGCVCPETGRQGLCDFALGGMVFQMTVVWMGYCCEIVMYFSFFCAVGCEAFGRYYVPCGNAGDARSAVTTH